MKRKRSKPGEFTEEEMEFLLKKVERGTLIAVKERIELESVHVKFITKPIWGTHNNRNHYDYTVESKGNKSREEQKNSEQKARILKAITESDDFAFEYYGDYDDDGSCTLVTYTLTPEPEDIYLLRLKLEGRQIITAEKARLTKMLKLETRKVLIEKNKRKKSGRPKNIPVLAGRPFQRINRYIQY